MKRKVNIFNHLLMLGPELRTLYESPFKNTLRWVSGIIFPVLQVGKLRQARFSNLRWASQPGSNRSQICGLRQNQLHLSSLNSYSLHPTEF